MAIYKVLIHGRHFILERRGEELPHGFYATRYLEADDAKQVEALARGLIWEDFHALYSVQNDELDPPIVVVTEIEEVKSRNPAEGRGYVF
ncbi:MAG: hypothetical protein R3231_08580 [bacterium]|nr:hypothetical protein [bacterium]